MYKYSYPTNSTSGTTDRIYPRWYGHAGSKRPLDPIMVAGVRPTIVTGNEVSPVTLASRPRGPSIASCFEDNQRPVGQPTAHETNDMASMPIPRERMGVINWGKCSRDIQSILVKEVSQRQTAPYHNYTVLRNSPLLQHGRFLSNTIPSRTVVRTPVRVPLSIFEVSENYCSGTLSY